MTPKNEKYSDDEVNLKDFFVGLGSAISSSLRKMFHYLICLLIWLRKFIKREYKILLLGVVIGGIYGTYTYNTGKPTYFSRASIASEYLTGYYFIREVEKINQYCKENNYDYLSTLFQLPVEELKMLKGISAETFSNYYNIFDRYGVDIKKLDSLKVASEVYSSEFILTIYVSSDEPNFKALEKGLSNYFQANSIIQKQYKIDQESMLDTRDKIVREINNLDSLKGLIYRTLAYSGNANDNTASLRISVKEDKELINNPLNIYDKDYLFFTELQKVEKKIKNQEAFKFINGFSEVKYSKVDFFYSNLYRNAVYGLVIAIIFLSVLYFNRFLNVYEKEKLKQ